MTDLIKTLLMIDPIMKLLRRKLFIDRDHPTYCDLCEKNVRRLVKTRYTPHGYEALYMCEKHPKSVIVPTKQQLAEIPEIDKELYERYKATGEKFEDIPVKKSGGHSDSSFIDKF